MEGHADREGTPALNLDLSQRRARNVRAYLIKEGVAPERLEAVGRGDTRPLAHNASPERRGANRRVELTIIKLAPAAKAAPAR